MDRPRGKWDSFWRKCEASSKGIAAKVVVDENVNGRMGRTSRDICVGAFVANWSCRDVEVVGSPDVVGWPATGSSYLAFAGLGGAVSGDLGLA
jgi:hypothetical protein